MTATEHQMLGPKSSRYYVAVDVRTQAVIMVLEAQHEQEAQQFFAAVCHMLQVPPEANFRVLESAVPPNDTPVFLRIPPKLDTCSAANWTVVPSQTGHLFQAKLDTLDATARG